MIDLKIWQSDRREHESTIGFWLSKMGVSQSGVYPQIPRLSYSPGKKGVTPFPRPDGTMTTMKHQESLSPITNGPISTDIWRFTGE